MLTGLRGQEGAGEEARRVGSQTLPSGTLSEPWPTLLVLIKSGTALHRRAPRFTLSSGLLRWEVRTGSVLRDLGRVCLS